METPAGLTPEEKLLAFEQKVRTQTDFISFARNFVTEGVLPKVETMSRDQSNDKRELEFVEWMGKMVSTVLDNRKKQGMILGLDEDLVEFRNIDYSAAEHILDGKIRRDVTRGVMVGYLTSVWTVDMDPHAIWDIAEMYAEDTDGGFEK